MLTFIITLVALSLAVVVAGVWAIFQQFQRELWPRRAELRDWFWSGLTIPSTEGKRTPLADLIGILAAGEYVVLDGAGASKYFKTASGTGVSGDPWVPLHSVDDNAGSLTVDYATTGSGTATGALRVELPTNGTGVVGLNAGTNAIGKLAANSGVDIGDVDVTSVIAGTAATNLGKAEDGGHTTGDTGVMALAVRQAANAPLSGTDLDYEPLQTDANGHLKVNIIDALPAGTAAIGKLAANSGVDIGDVDVTSIAAGDNNIGNVDIQLAGTGITGGAGAVAAGTPRMTLASDDPAVASLSVMDDWDNTASDGASVSGDVAHDGVDAGEPVKLGMKAIAHAANPTAVAANDRTNWFANREGIPWVMGGHPNIITLEYLWTTAQTDDALVTVSAGTSIVVTRISVTIDEATTVGVGFRIGFGATTLPTAPTDGNTAAGYLLGHAGLVPGGGITVGDGSGMIGVGADGEDLRMTTEATTSGTGRCYVTYYTVAT